MSILKNVVVAGGGSTLGPFILSGLHKANFRISVLKRPNSTTTFPAYVNPIETDFSPSSLVAAFENQDAVVSILGYDGVPEQIKMIDAAEEAGVKRFIPSEFGWSRDIPMLPELAGRFKPKEEAFKYLVRKCSTGPMTWSAIASGAFIEWGLLKMPSLGFVLPKQTARIYDSGNEPWTGTTGKAVGTAVANLLLHPEETANRFLKITSFKITQNQLLAALEEVTKSKWEFETISTQVLKEERPELMKQKRFQEMTLGVIAQQLFEDGAERGITVEVGDSDNELLGVEEEDIVEILKGLI